MSTVRRESLHLIKQSWLDRAIDVFNFHASQLKLESSWTIEKTALALNRSSGSVCQDLLVASWTRTHEKQLRRCRSMRDALEYIRDKKKEMKIEEIE